MQIKSRLSAIAQVALGITVCTVLLAGCGGGGSSTTSASTGGAGGGTGGGTTTTTGVLLPAKVSVVSSK